MCPSFPKKREQRFTFVLILKLQWKFRRCLVAACQVQRKAEGWPPRRAQDIIWLRTRARILLPLIVMQIVSSTKRANLWTRCHPVCKANFDKVAFFSYFFFNKVWVFHTDSFNRITSRICLMVLIIAALPCSDETRQWNQQSSGSFSEPMTGERCADCSPRNNTQ